MIEYKASIFMISFLIELLIVEALFGTYLQKRKHYFWRYLIGMIVLVGYAALIPFIGEEVWAWLFSQISIFLLTVILMYICYEERFTTILFVGIAAYTIQHISSVLYSFLCMADPERFEHLNSLGHIPSVFGLLAICDIVIFLVCYWGIIKKMRGVDQIRMGKPTIFLLTGTIVLINHVWGVLFEFYAMAGATDWVRGSQYLWNIICCILCLFLQFGIFSKSKVEMELDIVKQLSLEKEKQYQVSKSTVDAINMKCHNLKYQLSQLQIQKNSEQILQETYDLIDTFDSEIKTGNEILDVIFTEKNSYCRLHQISFVCMIDGKKLDFMEVSDIYVLFGNLIDNAIHAVDEIDDRGSRSIYVDVHAENKLLHISTENCYSGTITFQQGIPETKTGDHMNHGFGIKTIQLICEKYGGNATASAHNNKFYLNIIIPIG